MSVLTNFNKHHIEFVKNRVTNTYFDLLIDLIAMRDVEFNFDEDVSTKIERNEANFEKS